MATGPKQTKLAPPTDPVELAREWQHAKKLLRTATDLERDLKGKLTEVVEKEGQPDQHGHIWYRLPEEIVGYDGKGRPKKYNAIERQRRVTVNMDENEAYRVLEDRRLLDDCADSWVRVKDADRAVSVLKQAGMLDDDGHFEVATDISEDKVRAAFWEGKITQDEYDTIFKENIIWALLPGEA